MRWIASSKRDRRVEFKDWVDARIEKMDTEKVKEMRKNVLGTDEGE